MFIREATVNEALIAALIALSEAWEAEESCFGYRANARGDIEGKCVFVAEDSGGVIGYLFGHICASENMRSIMPDGTPFFEVEELYVVPSRRREGIGAALFRFAEDAVRRDARYMVLSTATKNWRAVFHFYLDELDMTFWSARLFKPLGFEEIGHVGSAVKNPENDRAKSGE